MIINTPTRSWVPIVAWAQVALGSAGFAAVLLSPAAAVVVGSVVALIALTARALTRASRDLDRILAEELDR